METFDLKCVMLLFCLLASYPVLVLPIKMNNKVPEYREGAMSPKQLCTAN